MMREALKDRVGKRGEFHAQFKRRGSVNSDWGVKVTMLFVDIRDEAGTLVADHIWVKMGKQMEELHLQGGERVRFMATVDRYQKRDKDREGEDDGPRHVTDYRLTHPSNIRRVGAVQEERRDVDRNQLDLGLRAG